MRLIATILLIWPICVFGELFPEFHIEAFIPELIISEIFSNDVPPPYGVWECELKGGYSCKWEDVYKDPVCGLVQDFEQELGSFRIDLESSQFTATIFSKEGEPLHYLGPEKNVWTLVHEEVFIDKRIITVLNPNKGIFKQTWIEVSAPIIRMGPYAEYVQLVGTCTNITPKEPEKTTEGEDTSTKD